MLLARWSKSFWEFGEISSDDFGETVSIDGDDFTSGYSSSCSTETNATECFRDALLSPTPSELSQSLDRSSLTPSTARLLSPIPPETSADSPVQENLPAPLKSPSSTENIELKGKESTENNEGEVDRGLSTSVLQEVLTALRATLPHYRISIYDGHGFHVMLLSRGKIKAI
ncbi:hypothetical protein ONE63_003502 [Megalurothrips usitatus]|uniref:Uncharacterized protein n=1 Tax=Megalurothrips usitatus TaxID=439358 RepID=A0AAV7X6P7_9NEOP|nr:hypothetical protein ONE63_003502 [Megalurothrips usitatus]